MATNRHRRHDDPPPPEGHSNINFSANKKFYIIIIATSVAISLILSSIVSFLLMPSGGDIVSQEKFSQGIERMAEIEAALEQQAAISSKLDQNYEALQTHLRHSSSRALKNILLDQEQNFQAFLTVFKTGMRGLALELPDGLDWYNDHSDQIERALQHSMQRESILRQLQVGEVTEPVPTNAENIESEEDIEDN